MHEFEVRSREWILRVVGVVGLVLAAAANPVVAAEDPVPVPSSDWQVEAAQTVADSEYEVSWQPTTALPDLDAAWQAANRANGFRSYFGTDRVHLVPRIADEPGWELELAFAGVGRSDAVSPVESAVSPVESAVSPVESAVARAEGARVEYARAGIVEWYENTQAGLEQGFTLADPPDSSGEVALDLVLGGNVDAELSADGQTVYLRGPSGSVVLHYTKLTVVDALGRQLPARMEVPRQAESRGIRLVFDDADATYPVTVDPLIRLPDWSAAGDQTGSWFGYAVATAGDVNGDGYSDVIVGAPAYDNGQADEGRAFVYLGSASGLAAVAAWTAESDQASTLYGWSVATAGDVDGDGYDEVIVGAQSFSNGQVQEGKAFLYYGSATGPATTAAWTNEGDQAFAGYGAAVATAGDVNDDGFADVLVSAPSYDNGQADEGRVYLYLGSASGLATTPAWTGETDQNGTAFGTSLATAGDVNADGFADVIIGALRYSGPEFNEGRAYVYLGGPGGLDLAPVWTAENNQAGAAFGHAVATAGDVNGDGYADVVVGSVTWDNGQDNEGRAYVYHGTAAGVSPVAAWVKESDQGNARFGASVATAGDVNGDGYADVFIGADQYLSGRGRVFLYLGSSTGLSTTEAFYRDGDPATFFGTSVATAGDVDGDGFSDLIAGGYAASSYGGVVKVYRFVGADPPSTTPAWSGQGDQVGSSYGVAVASAGDVNGDGYSDVLVGADLHDNGQLDEGRADLYLGAPGGLSTIASWSVEGDSPGAGMGASVASAGDVNGDGYSDVIVGAPGYGSGGRVFVYYGAGAGPSTVAGWFVDGIGGAFGTSVASAGDVNGDGYSDIVIGAPYESGSQSVEGGAYLYLGSAAGLGATAAWHTRGNLTTAYHGYSVATAGDVNGDGYSDVIVGAYGYDNGQVDEGRAVVYLGSPAGLNTWSSWSVEGGTAGRQFGRSVASAGDVNGDGFSDVAVCVGDSSGGGIYHGSATGLSTTPAPVILGGRWVAPAGDMDLDGYSDILVGLPVTILRGSPSGTVSTYGSLPLGAGTYVNSIGIPLASAGDVNGDGFPDVVFGMNKGDGDQVSEGTAFVHLGGGPAVLTGPRPRLPRQLKSDGITPIALHGESDSETGFRLRAPGYSAAGRADIRLRWEVKPLGTPFDGSGLGDSAWTDTGAPGTPGSVASFDEPAAGLGEGTWYHWRARTVSADPFFPRSPWMSAVGNGMTETKLRMDGCLDADGDGYGALGDASCVSLAVDCDDANGASWTPPGETSNLRFTSRSHATWDPPASPGGLPSELSYDLVRSLAPSSYFADCVSSTTDPDGSDLETPLPGVVFVYISRARNGCLVQGAGGAWSDGTPRVVYSCP